MLEVCFRNCDRWQIVETPQRLATVRRIVHFQRRLVETGAFADPRSHIYYLPELYCAYFGRCYAALRALPRAQQQAIDPDDSFALIRRHVLAYVCDDLLDGRDQCLRRSARPARARQARRGARDLRAGARPASRAPLARAAGARRSRPMSGTR